MLFGQEREEVVVYSTEETMCVECDEKVAESGCNICTRCSRGNICLIKDSDGSWHIDPSLLDYE